MESLESFGGGGFEMIFVSFFLSLSLAFSSFFSPGGSKREKGGRVPWLSFIDMEII